MSTLTKGSVIQLFTARPYFNVVDGITGKSYIPIDSTSNANHSRFAINGDLFVTGLSTSPFINIYDTSTIPWTRQSEPSSLPVGGGVVAINPTGTRCAIGGGTTPYFEVYDTSTWTKITIQGAAPTSTILSIAFNRAGTICAVGTQLAPYFILYDVSDWSRLTDVAITPTGDARGIQFSPDDTLCVVGHDVLPYMTIYNTSDWSKVADPATLPTNSGYDVEFSPDGTYFAIGHYGLNNSFRPVEVYDVATLTRTKMIQNTAFDLTTCYYGKVAWYDNNHVLSGGNTLPSCTMNNKDGTFVKNLSYLQSGTIGQIDVINNVSYEINGTIDESLAASDWIAFANDLKTQNPVGKVEFTGTAFTIPVNDSRLCMVTVFAKQGNEWLADTQYFVGDKVIPTDPVTTPYYYTCTVAGISGSTEPVFPVTPGGTVVDGGATWERVERLIQPVTHSPIRPTVV